MGWRVGHFRPAMTTKGWRTPVAADGAGFPDLYLVRDRGLFLELKREKGNLSDAQKEWVRALLNAQVEVYVCRPRHLEQLAMILQTRSPDPRCWLAVETRALCGLD